MVLKEEILKVSMHEFGNHGYEACSTNEIARIAGVSKGSIFHYFESKERLYEVCCLKVLSDVTEYLDSFDTNNVDNLIEFYFEKRGEYLSQNKYQESLLYRLLWDDSSRMSLSVKIMYKDFIEVNRKYIRRCLEGRVIRPELTKDQVLDIITELHSVYAVKFFNKKKINEADVSAYVDSVTKMIDYLLNGVCVD